MVLNDREDHEHGLRVRSRRRGAPRMPDAIAVSCILALLRLGYVQLVAREGK